MYLITAHFSCITYTSIHVNIFFRMQHKIFSYKSVRALFTYIRLCMVHFKKLQKKLLLSSNLNDTICENIYNK